MGFGGKIPQTYWDEELAVVVAGHTDELKIIPNALRTKEVYKTFVSKRGTNIEQVPKNAIDEELCLIAMESNSFAALRYIPENIKIENCFIRSPICQRNIRSRHVHQKNVILFLIYHQN